MVKSGPQDQPGSTDVPRVSQYRLAPTSALHYLSTVVYITRFSRLVYGEEWPAGSARVHRCAES